MASVSRPRLWAGAFTGFYRPGVEEVRNLDPVSRFLYAARSVILVISAQAAIIAGLLAADRGRFAWPEFLGVLIGFVAAHMISNLSNDYFGFKRGHDTPELAAHALHDPPAGERRPRHANAGDGPGDPRRPRRRDRARLHRRARLAGCGLRRRRNRPSVPLRRGADAAQKHRARRSCDVPRLGPADDRRRLRDDHRRTQRRRVRRVDPLRPWGHEHPDGQAHRPDGVRLRPGNPHAAGGDRRAGRPAADRRRDRRHVSGRGGAHRRRLADALRRGRRRRAAEGVARDRRPEPATAGRTAARLCRLAALASSRLPCAQQAVRLGLYLRPRRRRESFTSR